MSDWLPTGKFLNVALIILVVLALIGAIAIAALLI